ncbi:MAG: hypothetical protein ACLQLH_03550 [Terracidiphilus sp.]
MTRVLQIAHLLLILTVTAAVGVLSIPAYRALNKIGTATDGVSAEVASLKETTGAATSTLRQAAAMLQTTNHTIAAAQPVLAKLGVTADRLNAGCDPAPCGTLVDVNRTLATVRGTFGQIEIAARHEDRNLTTLDQQEVTLFNDFHSLAGQGTATVTDLDALLKDKAIHQSIDNFQSMTTSGASILADGAFEAHKLAHPDKKKMTFWTATEAGGDFVRHFMPSIF